METASRPRRQSLGETERQPVFLTGLSTVDIDSKGGRAASTSKPKEAGRRKDDSKQFSTNRKPRQGVSTRKRYSAGSGRGADTKFKFSPYSPMMFGSSSPKPRRASAPSPRESRPRVIESYPGTKMEDDEVDGPPLEQCLVLPEEEDLESERAALVPSSQSGPNSEDCDAAVTRRAVDIGDDRAIISSYNYDAIVKKAMSVTQPAGESTGSVESTARRDHIDVMDCDLPVILDTSDVAVVNDAGQGGDSGETIAKANAGKSMELKEVPGQSTVPSTVEDDDIALEGVEEASIGEAAVADTSSDLELDDMVAARPLSIHDTSEAIQEMVGVDSEAEVPVTEILASMEDIVPVPTREAGVGDESTMVGDDESDVMTVVGTHSEEEPTVKSAGDTLEWPGPSLIILEEDTEDVGVGTEGMSDAKEIEQKRSRAPSEGRAEEYASGWQEKINGVHCISCATYDAVDFAGIGPADDDTEAISTGEGASTPSNKGLPVVTDMEVRAEEQTLLEGGDGKASGVEERAAVYRGQGPMEEDGQEMEAKNGVQVEAEGLQAEEKGEDSHKLWDEQGSLMREGHVPEQPCVDSAFAQGTDDYNGNGGTKTVDKADNDSGPVITEDTSAVATGDDAALFICGDVEQKLPGERIMDWEAVALEMEEEWVLGSGLNEASAVDPPGVPSSDVSGQSEAIVSSPDVASNPVLDDFNRSGFDGAGTSGTEVQESAQRVEEVKSVECDGFALLPSAGDGSVAMDVLPANLAAVETFGSMGGVPESVGAEIRQYRKEVSDVSSPDVVSNHLWGFDGAGTSGTEAQESEQRADEEVKSVECNDFALLPSAGDGSAAMDVLLADPAAAETFGSMGGGPESVGAEIRQYRKEVSDVSSPDVVSNHLWGFDGAGTSGTEAQESEQRVDEEVKSVECDGFALLPSAGDGSAAMDVLPADPASAETFGSIGGGLESVGAEIRQYRKEVLDVSSPDVVSNHLSGFDGAGTSEQSQPMNEGRESKLHGHVDGSCKCCVIM